MKANDPMDKAIDLEEKRQQLHEDALREIAKLAHESGAIDKPIVLLKDLEVVWSKAGKIVVANVTATEARLYREGQYLSTVQLKVLTVDMLLEILFAMNASV